MPKIYVADLNILLLQRFEERKALYKYLLLLLYQYYCTILYILSVLLILNEQLHPMKYLSQETNQIYDLYIYISHHDFM